MALELPPEIWVLVAQEADLVSVQALITTCSTLRAVLTGSLTLWRLIIRRIFAFSSSCALSQAIRFASVDVLRAAVLRFVRVQMAIKSGHAKDHNARHISLPPNHAIHSMVLLPGTPYFAYMDARAGVHLADLHAGNSVATWKSACSIQEVFNGGVSLWESPSHGPVIVAHIWVYCLDRPEPVREMWLLKVELHPGVHSAPTLIPLNINPELPFVSNFVVTFDDTITAVGEREDESTQICTFKISTTGDVEELQVWLLSEVDEKMLSSLEDFGMVSPNTLVAFSQNKICALRLPDDPNHNLQRFWHRNFIVGAWEDAKFVFAKPYVYEETGLIAFTLGGQLHTLRTPLDKIPTQLGPVEPRTISSKVNIMDRMQNCTISALGLYALVTEQGMCTVELHGKIQPSMISPTAESAWEQILPIWDPPVMPLSLPIGSEAMTVTKSIFFNEWSGRVVVSMSLAGEGQSAEDMFDLPATHLLVIDLLP